MSEQNGITTSGGKVVTDTGEYLAVWNGHVPEHYSAIKGSTATAVMVCTENGGAAAHGFATTRSPQGADSIKQIDAIPIHTCAAWSRAILGSNSTEEQYNINPDGQALPTA